MCTVTITAIKSGVMKWNAKNRVKVALFTEKPPQSHSTRLTPKYGIALIRFVMTVAPQNLICPQGST